jgi:hypothetical protein
MCLPQHPGSPENTVEKPHRSHLPISYVDRQEVSRIKIHVLDFPEGRDVVHMSRNRNRASFCMNVPR